MDELIKEWIALKKQLAEYEEVLKFYSNRDYYWDGVIHDCSYTDFGNFVKGPPELGKQAREILSKYGIN